jgi:hypothetical protein
MQRPLAPLLALAASLAFVPLTGAAETIGGNPGPAYNYVCPHADGQGAMACYLDAVEHLYTMCRNVKSIEILTYGYEDSLDGVNAAKYDSCVEKQKHNMTRPYEAALKEARRDKALAEALRTLHEDWTSALARIRWNRGESDADYKTRVGEVYVGFHERIGKIEGMLAEQKMKAEAVAAARAKPAHKAAARARTLATKSAAPGARTPAKPAAARKATPAPGSTAGSGTATRSTAARDKAPQS